MVPKDLKVWQAPQVPMVPTEQWVLKAPQEATVQRARLGREFRGPVVLLVPKLLLGMLDLERFNRFILSHVSQATAHTKHLIQGLL